MAEVKPRIVIVLEGGLVQDVMVEGIGDVEVAVVDWDADDYAAEGDETTEDRELCRVNYPSAAPIPPGYTENLALFTY